MDYEKLILQLQDELQKPLPGLEAQLKLTPNNRNRIVKLRNDPEAKLSAVLALVYPKEGESHILLTLRNSYRGVHSAQVSFPGGKREESDDTFVTTALRETREEVGIPSKNVQILGSLTEVYIPPSRFLVYPFVGHLNQTPEFSIDPVEVNKIIECPVSLLLDDAIIEERRIPVANNQQTIKTRGFVIDEHFVWGATGMMLSELKEIIKRGT